MVAEITRKGAKAVALAADLAVEAEVLSPLPRAAKALGPVSCLVNSASTFEMDDHRTATRAIWDRHIEINLRAPLLLCQAFADRLPTGSEGNIVNLLDQRVWSLIPYFMSHTISKAALWTLTRTLTLTRRFQAKPTESQPPPPGTRRRRGRFPRSFRGPGRG